MDKRTNKRKQRRFDTRRNCNAKNIQIIF